METEDGPVNAGPGSLERMVRLFRTITKSSLNMSIEEANEYTKSGWVLLRVAGGGVNQPFVMCMENRSKVFGRAAKQIDKLIGKCSVLVGLALNVNRKKSPGVLFDESFSLVLARCFPELAERGKVGIRVFHKRDNLKQPNDPSSATGPATPPERKEDVR